MGAFVTPRTQLPFPDALDEALARANSGVRDLGRRLALDPTFLSRLKARTRPVPDGLPERVAVELGLPEDYFPETRIARIVERLRAEPELLERMYASVVEPT